MKEGKPAGYCCEHNQILNMIYRYVLVFVFFLVKGPKKEDNRTIQKKTKQLVDIVEQRNALVELLDEERKR